jgi:hypothetical protein
LRSTERRVEDGAMKSNVSEFPKHPLPQIPQPTDPQRPPAQQPTVFVYERQGWEYRVISKEVERPLTQDELNALGKDGWELVGLVPLLNTVQFYLKRIRG